MSNVMEMKRSNLVLPASGYELDREEMCYVEGGIVGNTAVVGIPALAPVNVLTPNTVLQINQSDTMLYSGGLINNLAVVSVNTGMTPQCGCCIITIIGAIITIIGIVKK